ncbi:mycofactocin-coupled SDR family oxidoreductase [Streptosporangium sp. NPDC002544]|uniref:mycofactocin-coupled SDR family oxidoreductase n=1 Tax=unclassified Streptosporangium TaxID=2632669 RepID=UPI00332909C3
MHDGRVVFITGAARGQGRAAAVLFAEQGANVIAVDLCESISTVGYSLDTSEDLKETERLVKQAGGDILAARADVRDRAALQQAVDAGVDRFGRLDYVLCNAGVFSWTGEHYNTPQAWTDTLDVNALGTYHTVEVALPAMIEAGNGGSIIITSSLAGMAAMLDDYRFTSTGYLAYMAAKHAVIGMMRAYALMLGTFDIRVNAIAPGGVATPMIENESVNAMRAQMGKAVVYKPAMNMKRIEPGDAANASLWLCSEGARYITGTVLPIDGGAMLR